VKVDHQIGLEPTLGEHLAVMVEVCRELRRVLKPTGTLWINYGDCYATSPNGRSAADTKATGNDDRTFRDKPFSTIGPIDGPGGRRKTALQDRDDVDVGGWGKSDDSVRWRGGGNLKAKDLCMVPNRLAIALQEDGWWVRSEIIWAKPNPMPESIKDRPATAHEKIFLLSRAPRYHYDAEAVRQAAVGQTEHDLTGGAYAAPGQQPHTGTRKPRIYETPDGWDTGPGGHGSRHRNGREKGESVAAKKAKRQDQIAASSPGSSSRRMAGFNDRWNEKQRASDVASPRHSGHINHTGIEDTPRGEGRSLRNWEPAPVQVWEVATRPFSEAHFATFPPELAERCIIAGCPAGGRLLDPFGGAGTVGLVADRHGLDCTLIELNPEYAEIARKRITGDAGMFSSVTVAA
jgi:DNA modification methylase